MTEEEKQIAEEVEAQDKNLAMLKFAVEVVTETKNALESEVKDE